MSNFDLREVITNNLKVTKVVPAPNAQGLMSYSISAAGKAQKTDFFNQLKDDDCFMKEDGNCWCVRFLMSMCAVSTRGIGSCLVHLFPLFQRAGLGYSWSKGFPEALLPSGCGSLR